MYSEHDIEKIKKIILNIFKPRKIILFGSYALDNVNNHSDIDIMILLKKQIDRKTKLRKLYKLRRLFFKFDYEVDIILNTVNHYEDYKNYIGSINYSVYHDGKIIWTRN